MESKHHQVNVPSTSSKMDSAASSTKQNEHKNQLEQMFPVGDDYKLIKLVGQGGYGTVARALHIPSGNLVAIKRVKSFTNVGDAKRLLREVQILRSMGYNRNLVQLLDVIEPVSMADEQFQTLFFVFESMRTDLAWAM
jgi:mitogen-activated protein kinase 1/3